MNEFEMQALLSKSKEAWSRTQAVVKRVLGDKHTLQWMSITDRKRLTVLLVWEQRYKVSLEWMVETLLLHYQGKRKKIITGRRYRNPALPVRTVTLVSPTSAEIIEKEIEQAYPNDEHLEIWRERKRYEFLAKQVSAEGLDGKGVLNHTFVDFSSSKEFVDYYTRMVDGYRLMEEKIAGERRRKGKPFRNSPWR